MIGSPGILARFIHRVTGWRDAPSSHGQGAGESRWKHLTDEELRALAADLGLAGHESLSRARLIEALQSQLGSSGGAEGGSADAYMQSTAGREDPPSATPRQQKKIARLIGEVSEGRPSEFYKAMDALVAFGSTAVPQLIESLGKNPDWPQAVALGRIGGPLALEALTRMLGGSEKQRNVAAAGIKACRAEAAVEPIERSLKRKGFSGELVAALIAIGSPSAIEVVAREMVRCDAPSYDMASGGVRNSVIIKDLLVRADQDVARKVTAAYQRLAAGESPTQGDQTGEKPAPAAFDLCTTCGSVLLVQNRPNIFLRDEEAARVAYSCRGCGAAACASCAGKEPCKRCGKKVFDRTEPAERSAK